MSLKNKHILLGVTGSIAAYKSAEICRRLRDEGAIVRVVMTEHAKEFITLLTMQAVSGLPVHDQLFDLQAEAAMGHIELAKWADLILIAPASANVIAQLANGQANDLLSTLCLATPAPVYLAPAMNQAMWQHEMTKENILFLRKKHFSILDPDKGLQACGDTGPGRMLEVQDILAEIKVFFKNDLFQGKHIVVTAGPTHEAIDPVRYIANGSSGKMGYAIAKMAQKLGARVTLISGPTALTSPDKMAITRVKTGEEMLSAVMENMADCDIFFSVAAVSDYRVQEIAKQKIPKEASLNLTLVKNPDIVARVGQLANKPFIVGFAAETEHLIENARNKRKQKNMDVIIANLVGPDLAMNQDHNQAILITEEAEIEFPLQSKTHLAKEILTLVHEYYRSNK